MTNKVEGSVPKYTIAVIVLVVVVLLSALFHWAQVSRASSICEFQLQIERCAREMGADGIDSTPVPKK